MTEQEAPRRRGRKPKEQSPIIPPVVIETPEISSLNVQETKEVKPNPVGAIKYAFLEKVFSPEARTVDQLSLSLFEAQMNLLNATDPLTTFTTLSDLSELVVNAAASQQDESLETKFSEYQSGFNKLLEQLNPPSRTSSQTQSSQLPPMTGRKG